MSVGARLGMQQVEPPGSAVGEHAIAEIGAVSWGIEVMRLYGLCPRRAGGSTVFRRGAG
jgi:hypothetical protein